MVARQELSLEAPSGDGVAILRLTQSAQATRAEDLDSTRVILATDAVDCHAPLGLAPAGGIRLVVSVIALAELASAVEAGDLHDLEVGFDDAIVDDGRV